MNFISMELDQLIGYDLLSAGMYCAYENGVAKSINKLFSFP